MPTQEFMEKEYPIEGVVSRCELLEAFYEEEPEYGLIKNMIETLDEKGMKSIVDDVRHRMYQYYYEDLRKAFNSYMSNNKP